MRVAQALPNDLRIICNCNLWLRNVWMPELLPFKTIEAFVSDVTKRRDLFGDRNVAAPGQDIMTIFSASHGIFQMRMPDPRAKLLDRKIRIFVRSGECVMGIPEQPNMFGIGLVQHVFQRGRSREVVM